MTRIIGLTGGIGSGKSTISQMLGDLGAKIIDADKVGHEAYLPETETWQALVAAFGRGIVAADGTIDRKKLGESVFAEPGNLEKLNSIVHPRMYDMIRQRIVDLKNMGVKVIVLDAAVLFEAKWDDLVDEIWVVTAGEEAVVQRAMSRTGLTEEQIKNRLRSQMSDEERIKRAKVVVHNDGSVPELRTQIAELWEELRRDADT